MDTGRWKQGDEFPVLDFVGNFQFKTAASVSFDLGKSVDRHSPRLPEMEPDEERIDGRDKWDFLLESGSVFVIIGWLDVHHPCDGFHPLRLRVGLPDRYVCWEWNPRLGAAGSRRAGAAGGRAVSNPSGRAVAGDLHGRAAIGVRVHHTVEATRLTPLEWTASLRALATRWLAKGDIRSGLVKR